MPRAKGRGNGRGNPGSGNNNKGGKRNRGSEGQAAGPARGQAGGQARGQAGGQDRGQAVQARGGRAEPRHETQQCHGEGRNPGKKEEEKPAKKLSPFNSKVLLPEIEDEKERCIFLWNLHLPQLDQAKELYSSFFPLEMLEVPVLLNGDSEVFHEVKMNVRLDLTDSKYSGQKWLEVSFVVPHTQCLSIAQLAEFCVTIKFMNDNRVLEEYYDKKEHTKLTKFEAQVNDESAESVRQRFHLPESLKQVNKIQLYIQGRLLDIGLLDYDTDKSAETKTKRKSWNHSFTPQKPNGKNITIKCENAELKVYGELLCKESPVFNVMLRSDMKEGREGIVEMSSTLEVVKAMMDILETDCSFGAVVKYDLDILIGVILVSHMYSMTKLHAVVEERLLAFVTLESVVNLYGLADQFDCPTLLHNVKEFMIANRIDVVTRIMPTVLETYGPILRDMVMSRRKERRLESDLHLQLHSYDIKITDDLTCGRDVFERLKKQISWSTPDKFFDFATPMGCFRFGYKLAIAADCLRMSDKLALPILKVVVYLNRRKLHKTENGPEPYTPRFKIQVSIQLLKSGKPIKGQPSPKQACVQEEGNYGESEWCLSYGTDEGDSWPVDVDSVECCIHVVVESKPLLNVFPIPPPEKPLDVSFLNLYRTPFKADMKIFLNGKYFKVYRSVLEATSQEFFPTPSRKSNQPPSSPNTINFPFFMTEKLVGLVLTYMYHGILDLVDCSLDDLCFLHKFATKYKIKRLEAFVMNAFMDRLTFATAPDLYSFMLKIQSDDAVYHVRNYIFSNLKAVFGDVKVVSRVSSQHPQLLKDLLRRQPSPPSESSNAP